MRPIMKPTQILSRVSRFFEAAISSRTKLKKGEKRTSMKAAKQLVMAVLTLAVFIAVASAQTETSSTPAPDKQSAAPATSTQRDIVTPAEFEALKNGLAAAQQQIQALQDELHRRDQAVQQAQTTAADAAAKADAAQLQASQQQQTVSALKTDLADLKSVNATSTNSPTLKNAVLSSEVPSQAYGPDPAQAANQEEHETYNKQMEGPLTLHFRGINITPGGYAAAEFVRRSRALGADVATPYNSLTMPGASQSTLSEFFGSGRQSKVTAFVDGRLKNVDLSSYVSADFLSAGTTSTSNQTNGYTLRIRQAWGQVKFNNGWSFLGGQAWSLVTENGRGISPDDDIGRTNDARPKTIDSTYNVAFVHARQGGIRLTKAFGDKFAIAVAVEAPQATLTAHGNAANYLLGSNGATNSYNSLATYSFNPSPDLIAKIALDPGFGHYEVFGIYSRFRDRIFPCGEVAATASCGGQAVGVTSAVGAFNSSKDGGGGGASARFDFAKRITIGAKGFGGSGVGRYGPAGLPDTSIYADGRLHLVRNLMGLGTLELHLTKKLELDFYGGAEYASRTGDFDPILGKQVGYGSPKFKNSGCFFETAPATTTATGASNGPAGFDPGPLVDCTADTRVVIEGTGGLWYRFYSGPRGRFQFGTQYSYVTRETWSGAGFSKGTSLAPTGLDNMVFTSFRYYLP